jgi:hypothetical protein
VTTTTASTLTTAQRMSDRIFRRPTDMGPTPAMPHSASLTPTQVLMLNVANLPDGRPTFRPNLTHLTRRENEDRPFIISRQQSSRSTSTADQLTPLSNVHLDIVNVQTGRNILERHCIAVLRLNDRTTLNRVTRSQTSGGKNISLLAISVLNQSNMTRPIRIVLNGCNQPENAVFGSLEINPTVNPTSTTTAMPRSDSTVMISSAMLLETLAKRLFWTLLLVRKLSKIVHARGATPCRSRFVFDYAHELLNSSLAAKTPPMSLIKLEQVNVVVCMQNHGRLFPI